MCIGSRCYTSDHVVGASLREEYFGRSRVSGYLRLKIGGPHDYRSLPVRCCTGRQWPGGASRGHMDRASSAAAPACGPPSPRSPVASAPRPHCRYPDTEASNCLAGRKSFLDRRDRSLPKVRTQAPRRLILPPNQQEGAVNHDSNPKKFRSTLRLKKNVLAPVNAG